MVWRTNLEGDGQWK